MVKMQVLFFILGIIFLFSAVAYFSYEYLFSLSDAVKTIILICLCVIFFFAGEVMREREI
jgi:hypothetical protein